MTIDVKKAREIIAAATPGPWESRSSTISLGHQRHGSAYGPLTVGVTAEKQASADADFIAAARTGWPEALDEIERLTQSDRNVILALKAENAKLREALQEILTHGYMPTWAIANAALKAKP